MVCLTLTHTQDAFMAWRREREDELARLRSDRLALEQLAREEVWGGVGAGVCVCDTCHTLSWLDCATRTSVSSAATRTASPRRHSAVRRSLFLHVAYAC
jgi:hypothetical protein